MKRFCLLLISFFSVTGCWFTQGSSSLPAGASPFQTIAVVDMVSIINSQKTLLDHYESYRTGLDCSTPRAELDGGPWCISKPAPYIPPPQPYCYRTLGDVDCYPAYVGDPYGNRLPIGSQERAREIMFSKWD